MFQHVAVGFTSTEISYREYNEPEPAGINEADKSTYKSHSLERFETGFK